MIKQLWHRTFLILSAIGTITFFTALYLPSDCFASSVQVENVNLDKSSFTDTWGVKGMVRNLGKKPIKGYVKIKYLNGKGDIVQSVNAWVNDGDPLDPGQAGSFEYWDSRKNFDGITNFKVIFNLR